MIDKTEREGNGWKIAVIVGGAIGGALLLIMLSVLIIAFVRLGWKRIAGGIQIL